METTAHLLKMPAPVLKIFIAFFKKDEAAAQRILEEIFDYIIAKIDSNYEISNKEEIKNSFENSKKQFVFL